VLDDFVASTHADLAALERARAAGALADVTREAHKIKGAARMVGAMELGEAADRLEAAGRAEDWTAVAPLATDVATAAQRLALYVASRWPSA
jgi:two-component system sensor histidine kinase EvgS